MVSKYTFFSPTILWFLQVAPLYRLCVYDSHLKVLKNSFLVVKYPLQDLSILPSSLHSVQNMAYFFPEGLTKRLIWSRHDFISQKKIPMTIEKQMVITINWFEMVLDGFSAGFLFSPLVYQSSKIINEPACLPNMGYPYMGEKGPSRLTQNFAWLPSRLDPIFGAGASRGARTWSEPHAPALRAGVVRNKGGFQSLMCQIFGTYKRHSFSSKTVWGILMWMSGIDQIYTKINMITMNLQCK